MGPARHETQTLKPTLNARQRLQASRGEVQAHRLRSRSFDSLCTEAECLLRPLKPGSGLFQGVEPLPGKDRQGAAGWRDREKGRLARADEWNASQRV